MPRRMLGLVAAAEFLGLTMWFSATAVTTAIARDLSLDGGTAAWLTMAVQAGFVVGTLVSALASLPVAVNARRLFALGCVTGAVANAGVTIAQSAAAVVALRLATGFALAWVYPPALNIAAGWTRRRRGTLSASSSEPSQSDRRSRTRCQPWPMTSHRSGNVESQRHPYLRPRGARAARQGLYEDCVVGAGDAVVRVRLRQKE